MIKAFTHTSFSITGRGIIVFLQHDQSGLPAGTVLRSVKSNLTWVVGSRILFDHVFEKQIKFAGETLNYVRISFESTEKKERSIKQILDDEKQGIFQYLIKSVGHDKKPDDKEELEVENYRPVSEES